MTSRIFRALLLLLFYELHIRLGYEVNIFRKIPGRTNISEARELARIVAGLKRRIPFVRCLAASRTLIHLLEKTGLEGEIRAGVRRSDGSVIGHAWVIHQGNVILGQSAKDPVSSYSEFQGAKIKSWA